MHLPQYWFHQTCRPLLFWFYRPFHFQSIKWLCEWLMAWGGLPQAVDKLSDCELCLPLWSLVNGGYMGCDQLSDWSFIGAGLAWGRVGQSKLFWDCISPWAIDCQFLSAFYCFDGGWGCLKLHFLCQCTELANTYTVGVTVVWLIEENKLQRTSPSASGLLKGSFWQKVAWAFRMTPSLTENDKALRITPSLTENGWGLQNDSFFDRKWLWPSKWLLLWQKVAGAFRMTPSLTESGWGLQNDSCFDRKWLGPSKWLLLWQKVAGAFRMTPALTENGWGLQNDFFDRKWLGPSEGLLPRQKVAGAFKMTPSLTENGWGLQNDSCFDRKWLWPSEWLLLWQKMAGPSEWLFLWQKVAGAFKMTPSLTENGCGLQNDSFFDRKWLGLQNDWALDSAGGHK